MQRIVSPETERFDAQFLLISQSLMTLYSDKAGISMNYPVISASSYVLFHAPDILKHNGSTQVVERLKNPDGDYLKKLDGALRSFDEVLGYAPNQCFIGNMLPDELSRCQQPWHEKSHFVDARRFGDFGEIMPEEELYGLVAMVDSFDLVKLTPEYVQQFEQLAQKHPILSKMTLKASATADLAGIEALIADKTAEPLYLHGTLVGCVKQAHDTDESLNAHVMLENLMTKASGVIALWHLSHSQGVDLNGIDYIIECSEEACGDMNQRGGGNFAKAMGEMAQCSHASGSDLRSFCAAPAHAMLQAAALVQSGVYQRVAVVAGGAVAKLGMNGRDHVKKDLPVLEDTLGAFAFTIERNDGIHPVIRTDIVGRHTIGTGSSPQAVTTALVTDPLDRVGLKIVDIDKFAAELQNPEITMPAGAGNVPEANFKMIAALGVKRGELPRTDILEFVKKHGMPGFAPTQGHIPSGVPFLGHAMKLMQSGEIQRTMIIGKGSLFLGRMTNLFDGLSFVVENNSGQEAAQAGGFDEAQVKQLIADAMRQVAERLLAEGQ